VTSEPAADRIRAALRSHGLKVRGKYADCPTHSNLKLSVKQDGNRAWVSCYKGCADTEILAAIGLTVGDLFDEPRSADSRAGETVTGQDSLDLAATDADPSPWNGLNLTERHRQHLAGSAITPEVARAAGIYSVRSIDQLPAEFAHYGAKAVPALAFPWRSPSGAQCVQLRPDVPIVLDPDDEDATPSKYLWPGGTSSILNVIRANPAAEQVLVVEGTKQSLAAASYAPEQFAVYGIAGCRSWSTGGVPLADLEVFDGKRIVLAFDADIASNADVHAAAVRLTEALEAEGASEVRYLKLPAGDKSGLDDVLASRSTDRRSVYLKRLIDQAKTKLPPKPARKVKRDGAGTAYFGDDGLLVEKLYHGIIARHPAALTRERRVALYRNGVFHIDGTAFSGTIADMLGDRFRPGHRAAVEEYAAGTLYIAGLFLPERCDMALLNVRNGMLDLATGTLKPHDPSYLSSTQLAVDWDPRATCPTYDRWLRDTIGDQADDLEEVTSTMLDPSRTPTKAVFLFGPSRSGKSTYLRIMQAVAGPENMSAVTLHQLAANRFAAANVYGKILNCAADLSSAHIEDLSIFKMMTGEDPIQADRKFGTQFAFVNRALFAFSANELPTVSESSRAYVERIKPFEFPKSFAGREDPTIEARMMAELPGILVRWVRAWQRLTERGAPLQTDERVRKEFEIRSDRVRQWVAEACVVQAVLPGGPAVLPGSELPMSMATTKRQLAQAFNRWAEQNNGSRMGERKIIDRLTSMKGVVEVRRMPGSIRALNVTLRAEDDEPWAPDDTANDHAPAVPAVLKHCATREAPSSHPTCENGFQQEGGDVLARKAQCVETAGTAGTAEPSGLWSAEAACPQCRWPLDSHGHLANCAPRKAA
jgi:putative DNA primase/helicase